MPCISYQSGEFEREERDRLSRILCFVMGRLDARTIDALCRQGSAEAGELNAWWTEHQRRDAERVAREEFEKRRGELRAQAIYKLTDAERKALGL